MELINGAPHFCNCLIIETRALIIKLEGLRLRCYHGFLCQVNLCRTYLGCQGSSLCQAVIWEEKQACLVSKPTPSRLQLLPVMQVINHMVLVSKQEVPTDEESENFLPRDSSNYIYIYIYMIQSSLHALHAWSMQKHLTSVRSTCLLS